ncbi:hypothetical protein K523DRAFT_73213 [Schizophyllum commune Tattone D]|nr:hypothetical protein K523DRAFT_73213 [Schizophyllum commune Tattone D]
MLQLLPLTKPTVIQRPRPPRPRSKRRDDQGAGRLTQSFWLSPSSRPLLLASDTCVFWRTPRCNFAVSRAPSPGRGTSRRAPFRIGKVFLLDVAVF